MSSSSRKRHFRNINSVAYLPPRSQPPITFSDANFSVNDLKQDDLVEVTAIIAHWRVHKILIDQGNSVDVLYWSTFLKLNVLETVVQPYTEPLLGFASQRVDENLWTF